MFEHIKTWSENANNGNINIYFGNWSDESENKPIDPDKPVNPTNPIIIPNPTIPDNPNTPTNPDNPNIPNNPENPPIPTVPTIPNNPDNTNKPTIPSEPVIQIITKDNTTTVENKPDIKVINVNKNGIPTPEDDNVVKIYNECFGGKILRQFGALIKPIKNVIIRVYDINNKLVTISKTDENGIYVLFLESGIYKFIFSGCGVKSIIPNIVINNGMAEKYCDITKGYIYNKSDDVFSYVIYENNNYKIYDKKLITLRLIDEDNNLIKNSKIIISKNMKLITFRNSDKNGLLRFALNEDIYDIEIRGDFGSKKIYNFEFESNKSFRYSLLNNNLYLNKNACLNILDGDING